MSVVVGGVMQAVVCIVLLLEGCVFQCRCGVGAWVSVRERARLARDKSGRRSFWPFNMKKLLSPIPVHTLYSDLRPSVFLIPLLTQKTKYVVGRSLVRE